MVRAITVRSYNGSYMLRALTTVIKAIFFSTAKILCSVIAITLLFAITVEGGPRK
jgi:hypothetical protein